ncbi:SUKH-4 family immunity protein [Streptomyces sp. RB6PN25]|uniref:SUKH-4 family immunity protein n=1 Tax=Streptomyces humicola TaxID=2953240 RepID=A0ABT1PS74_9ACTN|nr:SUKH-4 family immunity protein [Streptomyces humicola]MCQ4080524.1 SUKH-4 family immunity protein [Streptomyces humicola]
MVTHQQAQERAEQWINADVPPHQRREVQVRQFDLGFVAWAEDAHDAHDGQGGRSRLVIAHEDGQVTLWPGLPVDEVIRQYALEYGDGEPDPEPGPVQAQQRVDLEATSFLLSPPQWLQDAADKLGIPDRRRTTPVLEKQQPVERQEQEQAREQEQREETPASASAAAPASAPAWSDADTPAVPPATVSAPPISGSDAEVRSPLVRPDAKTELLPPPTGTPVQGGYIPTQLVPSLGGDETELSAPSAPSAPGTPPPPPPPPVVGADGDPHAAATMLAKPPGGPSHGPGVPTPPPPPPPPAAAAPAPMPPSPPSPPSPPPASPHAAPTVLAGPPGPPVPPVPPPPPAPGGLPAGYGYPQPPQPQSQPQVPQGAPIVGPGYMAVLRYRAGDGSEQQIIRRSAPGTPHPEWQILHELHGLGVPPQQVLELHTELESCDLPGGYCARMIRETWPQVRVSHTAPYGRDHASRQQGFQQLLAHQGELHQVADGPARPRPQRVPLPAPRQVQPAPPIPLEAIGQELLQAFGPQTVFRYDQRAVARAGVPDVVAQSLVWAGLPRDFGPFFWGYVPQPGRPVPTLAEVAAERGVQAAPDASSYLVMGNDFGRQLCVQYGTAHIMAVPLEATQGAAPGQASPAQFVNSSLPEFTRCLALLGRMWRLRLGLTPDQAGRWTVDFQVQLAALDPAALSSPDNWWAVLLEQMWDGLL